MSNLNVPQQATLPADELSENAPGSTPDGKVPCDLVANPPAQPVCATDEKLKVEGAAAVHPAKQAPGMVQSVNLLDLMSPDSDL